MLPINTVVAPIVALAALLPFTAALPKAPETHKSLNIGSIGVGKSDATQDDHLAKRWDDGHGPISSGYWSIVFIRSKGYHPRVMIKGEGWEKNVGIGCPDEGEWTSITSPLPWTIEIHKGNACSNSNGEAAGLDNVWIKYGAEFLNTPADTRCGRVGYLNGDQRCIIKV